MKMTHEAPQIGQTLSRDLMPQIGSDIGKFKSYLAGQDIESKHVDVSPKALRSTQSEFDHDKVFQMMASGVKTPIVVSQDNHVLDGHHRWLAAHQSGEPTMKALKVNLPILDLVKMAKDFKNNITEEITHKDFGPMMDSFVSFASEKLGISSIPKINFKKDDGQGDQPSFGGYNPSSKEIVIATKNRHPLDVFRTLAHELVHHKQNEEGRIKDVAQEGSTGSPIEDEANYMAGRLMRWFAKTNPNNFVLSHIIESDMDIDEKFDIILEEKVDRANTYKREWGTPSLTKMYIYDTPGQEIDDTFAMYFHEGVNDPAALKAIFMAGGPGSGKDWVMGKTTSGMGFTEINSDTAFEYLLKKNRLDPKMPDHETEKREPVRQRAKDLVKEKQRLALMGRKGLIINGTGDDHEKVNNIKTELEKLGYDTKMMFVHTANEVSRHRNIMRGQMGGRKVPDGHNEHGIPDGSADIRQEKWKAVMDAKPHLQKMFGKDFHIFDNSHDANSAPDEKKKEIHSNLTNLWKNFRTFAAAPPTKKEGHHWIKTQTAVMNKIKSYSFGDPRKQKEPLVNKVSNVPPLKPTHVRSQGKIVHVRSLQLDVPIKEEKMKKLKFKRKELSQEQRLDGYLPRDPISATSGIGPEFSLGKSPALTAGIAENKMRESWDAIAKRDMGTVPYSHAAVDEESDLEKPVKKRLIIRKK